MEPDGNMRWDGLLAATAQLNAAVAELTSPQTAENGDKIACQKVVEAAQKILVASTEPSGSGMEAMAHLSVLTVNRLFWEWGVFDHIPVEGSISYSELATKVDADVSLLVRLANVITSSGFLSKIGTDSVAHTPRSLIFMKDEPAGLSYQLAWENQLASYAAMPRYFQTYGRREPQSQSHVPVTFANDTPELTYYQVLKQDPARMQRFMRAMAPFEKNWPMAGIYDFGWVVAQAQAEGSADRPLFVDVGGGRGQAIKAIHKEFPGIPLARCVLQDLAEVIGGVIAEDEPELRGVQKMAIDFHQEQPLKGALVYWIRRCLHNYSDAACVNIMSRLGEALAEDSKILIQEDILDNSPSHSAAVLDMVMMNFGGKQRNLDDWERILSAVGLRVSGIFRVEGNPRAIPILECVKK